MKPTVPILCSAALAAMCTAVAGHWWSVRQFVAAIHASTPPAANIGRPFSSSPNRPAHLPAAMPPLAKNNAVSAPAMDQAQREFFEGLTRTIQNLQGQIRDLQDQSGETNRDLMNLEFQVDTHSTQFRPMPTSEDRPDTTLDGDEGSGVLPPRAEPLPLPFNE